MPLFNKSSEILIQNWDHDIEKPVSIKLMTTDHTEDIQFINFTEQILKTTSNLVIESGKDKTGLPGFLLKENVIYSALPLEKELEPFLEALSQINGAPKPLTPDDTKPALSVSIRQTLDTIDIPVRLKLYIALQCPHCPNVVRTLIPLALYCKNITLHIIDGSLFPETAQKDAVMSAPCLLLDDEFRWTGSIDADEIVKMVTSRDPSHLSVETLKTILEDGDATWIARQMIEKKEIFDSFIKLMLHETWSVRLGAMVIVEELVETDHRLAVKLCPILMNRFNSKDVTTQGDILYALGEAGDRETLKWVKATLPDLSHQDLIETANEAIETLESKYK